MPSSSRPATPAAPGRSWRGALLLSVLVLSACDGPQSTFTTGGTDATQLERLFVVMLVGAVILWIAINGLFFWVTRAKSRPMPRRLAEGLIIGGGLALPLIVLTVLVSYGLAIMPDQRAVGESLRLRVIGEQWWWRIEYWPKGAEAPVVSANEVRLPVGQRTEIELVGTDVIHSFWVPALGGKTDIIPGRINRMSLEPTEPGIWRGQCAEFCGESHALMAFEAVTMEDAEFTAWLDREAEGIDPPAASEGFALFQAQGCGACHALRGTEAQGQVGPDLTHVGGRESLAAGILPMTAEALAAWIRDPDAHKPGAEMPAYDHLSETELMTLATWLEGLE